MVGVQEKEIELNLDTINQKLGRADATELIEWSSTTFGDGLALSTSFGIQSAVMLHLVTQVIPNIPVIWIDTGYLPAETYKFAEDLTEKLKLNLKVYQSPISPARMEALHGKLWEQNNVEALNLYDRIRKVEPMQRALQELNVTAWLTGLRKDQTDHRKTLDRVGKQGDRYKILPILDWNSRQIYQYLTAFDLPYHPFFDLGYVTVGDWHSSRPLTADDTNERDTRFQGLKQECGLHLPETPEEAQSLDSSTL
jgi:phosphoadenosine phosphosulfate reductase